MTDAAESVSRPNRTVGDPSFVCVSTRVEVIPQVELFEISGDNFIIQWSPLPWDIFSLLSCSSSSVMAQMLSLRIEVQCF